MLRVITTLSIVVVTATSCADGTNVGLEDAPTPSIESPDEVSPADEPVVDEEPTEEEPTESGSTEALPDGDQSESDRELCDALEAIVDINDDVGLAMQPLEAVLATEGADAVIADEAQAVADVLQTAFDDLDEVYVAAIDAASDDLRSDLETVASTTPLLLEPLVDVLRSATTPADLVGMETLFEDDAAVEAAVSAGEAALRIDDFAIPTCGFRFSNT